VDSALTRSSKLNGEIGAPGGQSTFAVSPPEEFDGALSMPLTHH